MSHTHLFRSSLCAALLLLLAGLPSRVHAHTISFGYVDLGGGSAEFWIGSYHTDAEITLEGELVLSGPLNIVAAFDMNDVEQPDGLVEGTNYFVAAGQTADIWEGVSLTDLANGDYTVDVQNLVTATWTKGGGLAWPFAFSLALDIPPTDYRLGARGRLGESVGGALNRLVEDATGDLASLLEGLDAVPIAARGAALDALGHEESAGQMDGALRLLRAHHGAIRDRQRAARLGGGGGGRLALFGLRNDGARAGGAQGADAAASAGSSALPAVSSAAERWRPGFSVWARGRGLVASKDASGGEPGFEVDGRGGSAGLDVLLGDRVLLGLAGGRLDAGLDYDGSGSALGIRSWYASAYAQLRPLDALSVDVVATHGWIRQEQERMVRFGDVLRRAVSDPRGEEWAVDVELQYRLDRGPLAIVPLVGAGWLGSELDAYDETGAGAASLSVSSQNRDSVQTRLGGEVRLEVGGDTVRFAPWARMAWVHEFRDGDRGVRAHFQDLPGAPFRFQSDAADRDYAAVGAGVDASLPGGLGAFVRWDGVAGLADWTLHEITAGASWSF